MAIATLVLMAFICLTNGIICLFFTKRMRQFNRGRLASLLSKRPEFEELSQSRSFLSRSRVSGSISLFAFCVIVFLILWRR